MKHRQENTFRIATWNIKSWSNKDQEIILELNEKSIKICAISETRKKGKGIYKIENYLMINSGVPRNETAHSGVGFLIHESLENQLHHIEYVNHRILHIKLKVDNSFMHFISVYAPDTTKSKIMREEFYEELQRVIDMLNNSEKIVILGDLNARIGNQFLPSVTQRFNEPETNDNGDLLISFCAAQALRINNTFFDLKMKYKYTFRNTRGQQSIIDYIITNRAIHPSEILGVRTLNSANIGSDHSLVLCKLRLKINSIKPMTASYIQKFNTESFSNESTKILYQDRLKNKIRQNSVTSSSTVEDNWKTVQKNILDAAEEAIGLRKININKKHKTPWFSPEVKEICKKKKKAYLNFLQNKTPVNWQLYVRQRNETNAKIRKIKQDYWEKFSKDLENDLYGGQKKIWSTIRLNKMEIQDTRQSNAISLTEWSKYFQDLYKNTEREDPIAPNLKSDNIICTITTEEFQKATASLKNRKAAGPDLITNEMIKYGGDVLGDELTHLFEQILNKNTIPSAWKSSITIPLFKKGEKSKPENYRGITLLNNIMKLFTKIINKKIVEIIPLREEQQGFRQNRSTIDAIFIIRQLIEKSLEFNKPLYLCFIDLTKAFDRIKLKDVANIMENKSVPSNIIKTIINLNTACKTQIKVNGQTTSELDQAIGIRQGDSLSPTLFNLVMDRIIESLPEQLGYAMSDTIFNIVCYADDAVLMAEDENTLQLLINQFNTVARKFNMIINTNKTKSMAISKTPTTCNLNLEGTTIEQVAEFNYLGALLKSNRNLYDEVRAQTNKAARVSGCLKDLIWKNKYLSTESKTRVYKTAVRPLLTYAAETRADTTRTKNLVNTCEMRTLRMIQGKTLRDKQRNTHIRELCNIQEISQFVKDRRKYWKKHVSRMNVNRLARKAKDEIPAEGKRGRGRPPKRWHEC